MAKVQNAYFYKEGGIEYLHLEYYLYPEDDVLMYIEEIPTDENVEVLEGWLSNGIILYVQTKPINDLLSIIYDTTDKSYNKLDLIKKLKSENFYLHRYERQTLQEYESNKKDLESI